MAGRSRTIAELENNGTAAPSRLAREKSLLETNIWAGVGGNHHRRAAGICLEWVRTCSRSPRPSDASPLKGIIVACRRCFASALGSMDTLMLRCPRQGHGWDIPTIPHCEMGKPSALKAARKCPPKRAAHCRNGRIPSLPLKISYLVIFLFPPPPFFFLLGVSPGALQKQLPHCPLWISGWGSTLGGQGKDLRKGVSRRDYIWGQKQWWQCQTGPICRQRALGQEYCFD